MNALPTELLRQAQQLSEEVIRPIPGSRKIHVQGSRDDIRVPMREVALTETPRIGRAPEANAPFSLYDTSGPYTDPDACIDLGAGLAPLRAQWIEMRGDSAPLTAGVTPVITTWPLLPNACTIREPVCTATSPTVASSRRSTSTRRLPRSMMYTDTRPSARLPAR